MKNMIKKFQCLLDSISGKIIAVMICTIFPLNILVIFSTAQSISVAQEQARTSMEHVLNLYTQQMDNQIDAVNYYFFDLYENDASFIRLVRQEDLNSYYLTQTVLSQKFRSHIQTTTSADGYYIHAKKAGNDFLILPTIPAADITEGQKIRDSIRAYLGGSTQLETTKWGLTAVEGRQWLYRIFRYDQFDFGAVISLNQLQEDILAAIDYPDLTVVFDTAPIQDTDSSQIEAYGVCAKAGLHIRLSVPKGTVLRTLPLLQWIGIFFALVYLLLIPALLLWLSRILLRPLGRIREALLRLKGGEQDYRISVHNYAEEFRTINHSFNEMADNIARLKIENYEKEMAQHRMELRNLQLQIHPHFLLNMFKLVYSLSQIEEYENIQKLALYLSDYFRHIFRSGNDLEPFEKELALIKEYVEISGIRYPNRYTVRYDVDDAALRVWVPPLMVHNFVENIFDHALAARDSIQIALSAKCADDLVVITVSDSGSGMSEETVRQINEGVFFSKDGEGIHLGIYNSIQRMQHFYGDRGSISAVSKLGEGTRFIIRLPYERSDKEHEPYDCR